MNLLIYGTDRIGAVIEQNIEDAQYLRGRIEAESGLELLGPTEMNVVCFRLRPADCEYKPPHAARRLRSSSQSRP